MAKNSITVADYLISRLHELGIKHMFGVPGDYNLYFLDFVTQSKKMKWIGNCNELNGAYAADGYARLKGMSALLTTFGVGELSAANGVAGAYAEYCPIVHIVGTPKLSQQRQHVPLHHSFASGEFTDFIKMHSFITSGQAILTEDNPGKAIDDILYQSWITNRPVYIGLPEDIVDKKNSLS